MPVPILCACVVCSQGKRQPGHLVPTLCACVVCSQGKQQLGHLRALHVLSAAKASSNLAISVPNLWACFVCSQGKQRPCHLRALHVLSAAKASSNPATSEHGMCRLQPRQAVTRPSHSIACVACSQGKQQPSHLRARGAALPQHAAAHHRCGPYASTRKHNRGQSKPAGPSQGSTCSSTCPR